MPRIIENAPASSHAREFVTKVLPLTAAVWALGVALSFAQHGFLIGGARGVPLAGPDCHPGLWHLVLLGFVGGYVMALVGQATGLLSLPYDMSVLGFATTSVSPTVQWETFLNPLGALLGFRRSGQWNRDFALPLCVGGALGAVAGPLVRVCWLPDPVPFKAAVGVALVFVGGQMLLGVVGRRMVPLAPAGSGAPRAPSGEVRTRTRSWRQLTIAFGQDEWRMSVPGLVAIGALVGVVGTTLGVGGGFLLVPILAEFHRLPMRVIVAGSIPFVIVLSAVGLLSFNVTVPLLTQQSAPTEWAWGCFTGGAAIIGSWLATHSQRHIPEGWLRGVLGVANAVVGLLYVLGYCGLARARG